VRGGVTTVYWKEKRRFVSCDGKRNRFSRGGRKKRRKERIISTGEKISVFRIKSLSLIWKTLLQKEVKFWKGMREIRIRSF